MSLGGAYAPLAGRQVAVAGQEEGKAAAAGVLLVWPPMVRRERGCGVVAWLYALTG